MRIDLHAHLVPDAYRDLLVAADGSRPFVVRAEREDLEADMARYGIDAAVVSTGPPGPYLGDRRRAIEASRAANEALATVVGGARGRFAALGVLPLPDVTAAIDELAHALDRLGLDGVMLLTNVEGVYLGDPDWEPLYAELDRRGAYAFVHPTVPPYAPPLGDRHPVWLYEFPFETTRAIANLIFSGAFERHPAIRFQFAHLGGTAPFLAERLGSLALREPEKAAESGAGVAAHLARQSYDTGLTQYLPALEATRSIAPLERIVFGTDWPYAALPADSGDPAPALAALPAAEREAIEWRNAAHLVPRLLA
ncbi:MAG: amidohydrolase [Actinobacteria bacterium]|nr:amidohydrolase [Actinomycetota bacterium]